MIFSSEKWNNGEELKQHVKTSKALSFEVMATPLCNAFEIYLEPLLGEEMTEKLIQVYGKEEPSDEEKKLLAIAQKANGNLALYYDFYEINTRVTDSGFQRQENDEMKSLYQYQENNLRQSFRNKGFNALDRILEFLEEKIAHFEEFKKSKAYSFRKEHIVASASQANEFYFIASSRIVFLRMLPHLDFVEQDLVRPTLGESLYRHFKEEMFAEGYKGEDDKFFDTLRGAASRVMVLGAARRLMIDGGSLTDRGLYFSSEEPGTKSGSKHSKAEGPVLEMQLAQLKVDIEQAVSILASVAKLCFPQYAARNPRDAYNRDNTGKRTFFT